MSNIKVSKRKIPVELKTTPFEKVKIGQAFVTATGSVFIKTSHNQEGRHYNSLMVTETGLEGKIVFSDTPVSVNTVFITLNVELEG